MSGQLKQSRVWFAVALALVLMPGLLLSACDEISISGFEGEPSPSVSDEPVLVDGFVQILDPAFIISGCWRPVGADGLSSSGGEFQIIQVEPNAFTFRQSTRTKLVVNEAGSFEERNFDEAKPFFPPKYVHSVGQISEDGNRISRKLSGVSTSVSYRRCEVTIIQPLPVQGVVAGDTVVEKTSEPTPLVTPLVVPDRRPTRAPTPTFSMAPSVKPSSFLPPVPTPTPTPTPRPTPTPLPSVTPLALPTPDSDFSVSPTSDPVGDP